ncbi:hypothetical protein HK101_003640, partial [Irineochytrium annulatum]
RAYVVIKALAARGHSIAIVSTTPESLFADILSPPRVVLRKDSPTIDPGVLQSDAVSVDVGRSFDALADFLSGMERMREVEERWLKEFKPDCVLLDAPFVPAELAKNLQIPTIMVSNFSFDAIYDWIARPEDEPLCNIVRDMYDGVDYLLQLPGAIPMPSFHLTIPLAPSDSPDSDDTLVSPLPAPLPQLPSPTSDPQLISKISGLLAIPDRSSTPVRQYQPSLSPSTASPTALSPSASTSSSPTRLHLPPSARIPPPPRSISPASSRNPSLLNGATTRTWVPTIVARPDRAHRCLELPLVVRMARRSRADVRSSLGIPDDARVLLISFGGFKLEGGGSGAWSVDALLPEGWMALVAVPQGGEEVERWGQGRLRAVPAGYYVPDLMEAVDCVAGKCGYSTCAEVVAHRVPFVYVPRPGFAEEAGLLVNLMDPFGMAVEMPQEIFYDGNWASYIEAAHSLKERGPLRDIALNGEELAVEAIETIVARKNLDTILCRMG